MSTRSCPAHTADRIRLAHQHREVFLPSASPTNYDVTADGQRFVMLQNVSVNAGITLVQNWFEELRQRVPTD